MGLISKEVEVTLNSMNMKYYQKLGYTIPKIKNKSRELTTPNGTKIVVKVEDLSSGSGVDIEVICDSKDCENPIIKSTSYTNYKKAVHEDGKYYCQKCASKLFGREKTNKTKLENSISFYAWCKTNGKQDLLDRWDYELNNCTPQTVCYRAGGKYYFKCSKGIHKSELKTISNLAGGDRCKVCTVCNSFAQWGIDNICKDFLERYWDYEKNIINPWNIPKSSGKKVWIICQEKDYHESYNVICSSFLRGRRCPYCNNQNGKIHPLDSIGTLYPKVLETWSDKNKKSPYKYSPHSNQKVWWKCVDDKHEDYKRSINASNKYNFNCPKCIQERDESFLQEKVRLYLEGLKYTILHENNCTIIPKNPKTNRNLQFDNEIKELKLLCEVNGSQHYKIKNFHYKTAKYNNTTPEYELHKQQLHDRYKKFIAYKLGYDYLEIPYWTDDGKETWKQLINDKIEFIHNT